MVIGLNWLDFGVGFVFGGGIFGIICFVLAYFAVRWALSDKLKHTEEALADVQADYDYLVDSTNGSKGTPARERNKDRYEEALIDAAVQLGELPPGADTKPVLINLAKKYPDVAAKLLKQGVKVI